MKYIMILIFILCISPSLPTGAKTKVESYYATLESVTDGDTIKVSINNEIRTIRILGLDTPEIFTTRFGYSECYGKEASEYLKNMIHSGLTLYIESYSNDKYNRELADVYIGTKTGSLIAKNVIQNGYGWVYKGGIKTRNYMGLLKSENLAKRAKNGLWKTTACNGERRFIPEITTQNIVYNAKNDIFSCKKIPRYCSGVKTRSEAQFYLHSCGATKFDMDHDDIACEEIE